RRRHTRSKRDWSSDVCSSDLQILHYKQNGIHTHPPHALSYLDQPNQYKVDRYDWSSHVYYLFYESHELKTSEPLLFLAPKYQVTGLNHSPNHENRPTYLTLYSNKSFLLHCSGIRRIL